MSTDTHDVLSTLGTSVTSNPRDPDLTDPDWPAVERACVTAHEPHEAIPHDYTAEYLRFVRDDAMTDARTGRMLGVSEATIRRRVQIAREASGDLARHLRTVRWA